MPVAAVPVSIYHNPACGTSRNTLALVRNAGVEPTISDALTVSRRVGGFSESDNRRHCKPIWRNRRDRIPAPRASLICQGPAAGSRMPSSRSLWKMSGAWICGAWPRSGNSTRWACGIRAAAAFPSAG